MTDTIFALATAAGRAAVAVMRISGPGARAALAALCAPAPVPAARRASLRTLRGADGQILDRALAMFFPAPASYTGEDCVELHLHGGLAVVDAVAAALTHAGLRAAEPGEFTRRAFENGKLDLDQAEAVADLIDAQSAAQVRQALGQLEGALGRRYETWRGALTQALAHLEAAVDFPDEAPPADVESGVRAPVERVVADLALALADMGRGQRIREGYRIAIIGAPNAGKSSLFNCLTGRDAVIVTPSPGTTRDVIEAALDVAGYRVILADMAGLRRTAEAIEAEGVRRARGWAMAADLRLLVVDQAAGDGAWTEAAPLLETGDVVLLNKSDLPPGRDGPAARDAAATASARVIEISLVTDQSSSLPNFLAERVTTELAAAEFPAVTRRRHRDALEEADGHLKRAMLILDRPELAAEDVRLAARALARITGRIGAEDVLDVVFATFCIGK